MRILQLCKKFPYPSRDGEAVAVHALSKGLAKTGCKVSLLAFNTSKHFVTLDDPVSEMEHYEEVNSLFLDTSIDPLSAFLNLFSDRSYHIQRFDLDLFHRKLISLLQMHDFDVVQLESLFMAPYISTIRENSKALIAMRSHNLEFEIWKDLAGSSGNPLKKWYYNLNADRLKKYELSQFINYDTLIPISKKDFEKYRKLDYKGNVCMASAGLDIDEYSCETEEESYDLALGYIGSLDWKPNIEGIQWFIENAWSRIKEKYNNLSFSLAGRNAQQHFIRSLPADVDFRGEVDNAIEFLKSLDIVVVPLFSGSGIRIKILESMAMGKIVISTKKGFEGIDVEHGKNAFIFRSVDDIVSAIDLCIKDRDLARNIRIQARSHVLENFNYITLATRVRDHYLDLKNRSGR